MNFAQTILQQLGGKRFAMMTGAKNFLQDDVIQKLTMKIGRNAKKVTHVTISVNALDLYDITFLNIRGFNEPKVMSSFENVYAENMREIFESQTGMYLTL